MQRDPSAEEIERSHRWHAVECNNLAWALSELPERTSQQDEEMLHAAHAAAFHWAKVGTEVNHAHATMLLGRVHAVLGHGALALRYAQESYDYFTAAAPADWELAFAHAILADAARAAGEDRRHAHHHARAEQLGHAIADAEERDIFFKTFTLLPRPAASRDSTI